LPNTTHRHPLLQKGIELCGAADRCRKHLPVGDVSWPTSWVLVECEISPKLSVRIRHAFNPLGNVIPEAARAHGNKINTPGSIHFPRNPVQPRGPIRLTVIPKKLLSHRGEEGDGVLCPKPVLPHLAFEQHHPRLYLLQPALHRIQNHSFVTLYVDFNQ